jgi:hypothetical protein
MRTRPNCKLGAMQAGGISVANGSIAPFCDGIECRPGGGEAGEQLPTALPGFRGATHELSIPGPTVLNRADLARATNDQGGSRWATPMTC